LGDWEKQRNRWFAPGNRKSQHGCEGWLSLRASIVRTLYTTKGQEDKVHFGEQLKEKGAARNETEPRKQCVVSGGSCGEGHINKKT